MSSGDIALAERVARNQLKVDALLQDKTRLEQHRDRYSLRIEETEKQIALLNAQIDNDLAKLKEAPGGSPN